MPIHSTYSADCAIDRSISHTEITHIMAGAADIDRLMVECDDYADTSDDQGRKCAEYWGVRDGNHWRVTAHRPMEDDGV